MFYVIHGYDGPDHYTSRGGPLLEVEVFNSKAQVEKFYEEFQETTVEDSEIGQKVFRVIEGKELKMTPVQVITKYELE